MLDTEILEKLRHISPTERIALIEMLLHSLKTDIIGPAARALDDINAAVRHAGTSATAPTEVVVNVASRAEAEQILN